MVRRMSASTSRAGRILALMLVVGAAVTAVLVGVGRTSPDQAHGATSAEAPKSSPEAPPREQVFISGSMVNLRETASTKANVVKQVPIGTGCAVEEKDGSGWWRIRCGDSQGWTKAELLSAERPKLEPILALAEDTKRPLKERFDAALRASALEPEHTGARDLLLNLFAEQEWAQLERLLTRETKQQPQIHVSVACEDASSTEACIKGMLMSAPESPPYLFKMHHSERLGRNVFVNAELLGWPSPDRVNPLEILVRTGTFADDSGDLDVQVFAQSRYVPPDSLKNALAKLPEPTEMQATLSKLDLVLSEEEETAIQQLVGTWRQPTRTSQGFVLAPDCRGHEKLRLRIEMTGHHVSVYFEDEDTFEQDVGGVQLAKDGSITFRVLDGGMIRHKISPDDNRMSLWTLNWTGMGENSLFVNPSHVDDFPEVKPDPKECENL
ncbi:hypothetical protein [Cystobacter fuscus]|uniref:hypothetical protein n=1 Tax=Cystobacter fuscus TaxID=43 RepID=UPI002B314E67|nr:SH3 domain-containing protein [Cystobacter fuscus]